MACALTQETLQMKKMLGYLCLGLSILAWTGIAVLPVLDLSAETTAASTGALLIGGEIAFLAGVALLGRETWEKMKSVFRRKR